MNKDLKKLVRRLRKDGWRIEDRGKGLGFYAPDHESIVWTHKTPSDHRAMKNLIAELRRKGATI